MSQFSFIFLCLIIGLFACNSEQKQPQEVLSVEVFLWNKLNDTVNLPNRFMSLKLADLLEREMQNVEGEKFEILKFKFALQLFRGGQTEMAIHLFEQIRANGLSSSYDDEEILRLEELIALAYLRMGEQVNCIVRHTNESCIFPIQGSGIYTVKDWTREAAKHYEQVLAQNPSNKSAIWLLNIAWMTIGNYPDSVPAKYLINPVQFESPNSPVQFTDIAGEVGVTNWDLAGGVCLEDFNQDGIIDIVVSGMAMDDTLQIFYFVDGHYVNSTKEAGLANQLGGLNILHADYNNDGFPDILVLRGGWMGDSGELPNSLLRNNGDGTFTDVTINSGLWSLHPTQSGVFTDLNQDGWLDIIIANESRGNDQRGIECYLNDRLGHFTNIASKAGLNNSGMYKGIAAGDMNNDGFPDLYISDFKGENLLFINQGTNPVTFVESAKKMGVNKPLSSFPCWFWDLNQDGNEDIFVFNYAYDDRSEVISEYEGVDVPNRFYPGVYQNNGQSGFENKVLELGLNKIMFAMGANYADIDNDGLLDFYFGTGTPDYRSLYPNRMFRQTKSGKFEEISTAAGVGHLQKGHGVAFADLNQDGNQDMVVNVGGAFYGDRFQNLVFQNSGTENNWIVLKLEGVQANRSAIGTRVKIVVESNTGMQIIYRTVSTGGSFGANSLAIEAGLGNSKKIKEIQVNWPNGNNEWISFSGIDINSAYIIKEGSEPEKLNYNPLQFNKQMHNHMHQGT